MKIKLLNDGDYGDMEDVNFPVIVDGEFDGVIYRVTAAELYRVGANSGTFSIDGDDEFQWAFIPVDHAVSAL